jgi:hypothetical protein
MNLQAAFDAVGDEEGEEGEAAEAAAVEVMGPSSSAAAVAPSSAHVSSAHVSSAHVSSAHVSSVAPSSALAALPPPAPLEHHVAEAFSLIEANGDGVLSRAEVIKACRASERVRTLLCLPMTIRLEDGTREAFDERRYNLSLSGPILKDRLFFSYNFDDFQRKAAPPPAGFTFTAASLVLVDQAIARAKTLGYDAGNLTGDGNNITKQQTHLGKLDWNISDQHRASFTFRQNEGSLPTFGGRNSFTGSSLSNQWFDNPRDTRSYTVQFFSQWTPDLRTEASHSYTTYEGGGRNRGAPFPAIGIGGLSGVRADTGATANGFLNFGTGFNFGTGLNSDAGRNEYRPDCSHRICLGHRRIH